MAAFTMKAVARPMVAFGFLLMVVLGVGCAPTTTDRITGPQFFRGFELQLRYGTGTPLPKDLTDKEKADLKPTGELKTYLGLKNSPTTNPADDAKQLKRLRNDIVTALIAMDEQDFQSYAGDIGHVQRISSVASDITVLALTATATVAGGEETKAILAGLAAVFTGSRIAVDKDIFYQNTYPALVQRMKTLRDMDRAMIQDNLKNKSDDEYPLADVYYDVLGLYRYGTITGAIASLNQDLPGSAPQTPKPTDTDIAALPGKLTTFKIKGFTFPITSAAWDKDTNHVAITLDKPKDKEAPADDKKVPMTELNNEIKTFVQRQANGISATAQNANQFGTFGVDVTLSDDAKAYVDADK
jgi:hypothetical protein